MLSLRFKALNATLVFLVVGCSRCVLMAETLLLSPPTVPGAAIIIELEGSREDSPSEAPVTIARAITPIHFEVLEDERQRLVIGYTSGKPTLSGVELDAKGQKTIDSVARITADRTWELVFDKHFSIVSLRNLDEATRATEKILDLTKKNLKNAQTNPASVDLEKQLTSPKSVVMAMTKIPEMYFRVYGYALEPGLKRVEAGEVPNIFGTGSIPSSVTIELLPFEPDDKFYEIHFVQELDKSKTKKKVNSLVEMFMGDRFQTEERVQDISVKEEGNYIINRETQWVESATVKRIIEVPGKGSRIETFTFRINEK